MHKISIKTLQRNQIIDITPLVKKYLASQSFESGICLIYSPHTTAAISVNENYDPDVKEDMLTFMSELVPQRSDFHHAEGNSDSHIKAGVFNFSQSFIIENNQLMLGQWQGIYFMEFDGPRQRNIWVKLLPDLKQ